MKRKTFIQKTAGALLLAIPAYSLINCSSSDDGDPSPNGNGNPSPNPINTGDCSQNGTNVSIETNHGHVLMVSATDVNAGVSKTYNIQGSANHPHDVIVTAAHFSALKNNTQVTIVSSTDGNHSHTVTVSCAG